MPKRLLERWQPECIREFRAASGQRFLDGLALATHGRRSGAIYLWGYSAEMLLKAAYFSVLGIPETTLITWQGDLLPAINRGKNAFAIAWPTAGQGHNLRAWSELLVHERIARGVAYSNPLARKVQGQGLLIGQLWRETLRYHKNVAYAHETSRVQESVEWLMAHSRSL